MPQPKKGGKIIPCKKKKKRERENVNKHFRDIHQLRGSKGTVRMERAQMKQGNIISALSASRTYGVGRKRVKELQAAKFVIEKMLPLSFFSSGQVLKEMMETNGGNTSFPELPSRRMKHLITELYCATKKAVVGNMLEEVRKAPLPILHHMIDIWTDKASGRKFLGVHVFYVTANFDLEHSLLSIKRYSPAQGALGEAKAAEVLLQIVTSILHEFGLEPSSLASGTTDSGSDVKSVSVNGLWPKFGVQWTWCFCHLMVKAAEQAFGTHPDPAESKNPEARDVLKNVIKVVENLNKSSNFRAKFEDLQVELLGEVFKVVEHAPQRWLNLTRAVERVVRLWHVLRKLYSDEGRTFPLEQGDNKDGILQLYSLLQPLSSITRDGQYSRAPMMADIFMKFGLLKIGVLDLSKDLKVFDIPPVGEDGIPDRAQQRKPLPHKMVAHEALHPAAKKARVELCRALASKLYGRVWNEATVDPSFFCNASCLLTPPFSEGHYLKAMKLTEEDATYLPASSLARAPTSDEDVQEKLEEVWGEISKRTVNAVKTLQTRAEGTDEGSLFKRARTAEGRSGRRAPEDDQFAAFQQSHAGPEASGENAVEEEVASELMRYKGHFMKSTDLPPSEVLAYWKTTGKYLFPSLKYVAQQTFGSQASAAQIERDFSHCGLFCVPNRSRLEEYWLEMVMFLKGNYKLIPGYEDIPNIDTKDIKKCLPAKFRKTDEDLLKAEMAIDPLSNLTPPNEDKHRR